MKRFRVASDAKPNKRPEIEGKPEFAALDIDACLTSVPFPRIELASLLNPVLESEGSKVANSRSSDTRMRVETTTSVMMDNSPRPGRLAPRWLHDVYRGMLADCEGDTGDLFTRCEHLPRRLSLSDASTPPAHGHELLSIDIQCPEPTVHSQLISCICKHCKYHFLFHFEQDSPYICPTPDSNASENGKAIVCHLVLADTKKVDPKAEDVFNPVTQTGIWRCSVPTCSFRVSVFISEPRMKMEHIKLVVDEKRIARQRQEAIELDPVRFNPQNLKNDMEYTALTTLNAYLRDCLGKTVDEPPKRIATRNKRFYIQFGASCSQIFEYLGLDRKVIEDEEYWFLPELEHYPDEKTPIGTQRAFIEDARSEIQALIEEQGGQQSGGTVVRPWSEALFKLKRALSCPWWDTTGGKKPDDDDADFMRLGTLPNPDEEILKYAYERQVEVDPLRRKLYCDALQRLASNRSIDLQIFTATEASLIEQQEATSNTPLAQAYTHFNMPADCAESDEFVIQKYKVFCEQSPAQKVQHRQKLFLIGCERQSKPILEHAVSDFSFEEACDLLQLEPGVKAGNIPDLAVLDYYVEQVVENGGTRYMCSAALMAIADHFDNMPIRSYAAEVRRQGLVDAGPVFGNLLGAQDQITVASNQMEQVDLNLPPGLDNLRNTCYLNSILQYLYTVTPVRELVLNYDPTAAGLSDDLANQNDEVYLGREFTLELQRLFKALGTASTKFVKPQQRLANAAWLSPDKVAAADAAQRNNKQPTPPPLPARPAPVPAAQQTNSDPTVTVAPIDLTNEESPAPSTASSQTLINNALESPYDMMERDDQPPVVDKQKETAADAHPEAQSQLRALMAALDQTEVVGTDQMDVEEVMGRCVNHLRAAVNPHSVINTHSAELQRDIITDTFYICFANMRMEMGRNQYNRSISYERWVTANPGVNGPVHLYEALDNFFDRETIGEKILSYTAIVKPPPIFHVCIQRSKVGGGKNSHPVKIPEVLFLDRYMEAADDSPAHKARVRSWTIKAQLEQIAAIKAPKKADTAAAESASNAPAAADIDDSVDRYLNNWNFEPAATDPDASDEDYVIISPEVKAILDASPASALPSPPPSLLKPRQPFSHPDLEVDISRHIDTDLQTREELLRSELETLFAGLEKTRYRLHAVICHAGQTAKSGHYWVWIYDFGARVWRKYNDTTVTERKEEESAALLEELSKAGEPYYLAYVREEGLEGLVQVPGRKVERAQEAAEVNHVEGDMMEGVEGAGGSMGEEPPAYEA